MVGQTESAKSSLTPEEKAELRKKLEQLPTPEEFTRALDDLLQTANEIVAICDRLLEQHYAPQETLRHICFKRRLR